jgi:cyclophilin family peptidyl-prolyl cis-trans isomerase
MRRLLFSFLLFPILAGPAFAEDILVKTRLSSTEILDPQEVATLDLHDFFQRYPSPGPVATFVIPMPEPAGESELFLSYQTDATGGIVRDAAGNPIPVNEEGSPTVTIPVFHLQEGGEYRNIWEITDAEAFVWHEHELEYQLLAEQTPTTVANFITYVREGAYDGTIIHRNESNNHRFTAEGFQTIDNPLPIVQAGGWKLYEGEEDHLLDGVTTFPSIPFEAGVDHTPGTLAMARTQFLDSATSQFFFNVEDNTGTFSSSTSGRNPYSVFATPVEEANAVEVLKQFATAPIHDLTNIFPGLPFQAIPMYTPYWDDKDSYARIAEVRVSEGDPSGISYSWVFADAPADEEPSEEVLANRAAFTIEVVDNELRISRTSTGTTRIEVTGETDDGQKTTSTVNIAGYDEAALDLFPNSRIDLNGWLESAWYGFLRADGTLPFLAHNNHGNQYVPPESSGSFFLVYDYGLQAWLYTTSSLYPYVFNYGLETWLWYSEGTGNGAEQARWFYRFPVGDEEGDWLQEPDLIPAG